MENIIIDLEATEQIHKLIDAVTEQILKDLENEEA